MFATTIATAVAALTGVTAPMPVESPTFEPVPRNDGNAWSGALARDVDRGVVALVGDSITWEHAEVYADELSDCGAAPTVIDAIPGRMLTTTEGNPFGPIPSGLGAIERIEADLDPDTWLIELGVNDVNTGAFDRGGGDRAIAEALELLDPDDTVIWVGTWTTGPRSHLADTFTAALERVDRLTVTDWPDMAADLVYDGLHPTEEGARAIARSYCAALV